MSLSRIARPEEGILDFIASLIPHRTLVLKDENDPLAKNFHSTWDDLRSLLANKDCEGLKRYQTRLAPWPPVVLLALEPQTSSLIHAGWQMLLELHTCARWYTERKSLQEHPEWQQWERAMQEKNLNGALCSPAHTSTPGVMRENNTVAVVSSQPFSFSAGSVSLASVAQAHKNATDFRLSTPAAPVVDQAHRAAAIALFGDHSVREISKLAFWSMIACNGSDLRASLKWRPRYYGGPAGTPSWGLHDVASSSNQAASRSRQAMIEWMLNLSDSLQEQLCAYPISSFSHAHNDFLRAYTRSLGVVASIGMGYKRTISGVNEMLGYIGKIQDVLTMQKYPYSSELNKTHIRIKQQLRIESSAFLAL